MVITGFARPPVSFITAPTKNPNKPSFPLANASACLGFAFTTRSTISHSAASSEIWRTSRRSTIAEWRLAGLVALGEHFLADLAADRAVLDEHDQRGERRRLHRRLRDRRARGIQRAEQLGEQPVRDGATVVAAAHLHRALEVLRQRLVRDQRARVLGRDAELLVVANEARGRQLRQAVTALVNPSLVENQRQQVRIREVAIIVRVFLGAQRCASRPCQDRSCAFPA